MITGVCNVRRNVINIEPNDRTIYGLWKKLQRWSINYIFNYISNILIIPKKISIQEEKIDYIKRFKIKGEKSYF